MDKRSRQRFHPSDELRVKKVKFFEEPNYKIEEKDDF